MVDIETEMPNLPKVCCISQKINTPKLNDLIGTINRHLQEFALKDQINPGDNVAIAVGSRGITDQSIALKLIVEDLKDKNASPFIIPAMGSHGGGTAEGQRQLLEEYGITEEKIGCPIKATMDVVKLGESNLGFPVYIDKYAAAADKIIVVNKINTHSKFIGSVESGLSKMCLMGLGKQKGAQLYHRLVEKHSWPIVVESIREFLFQKVPIVCGFAIIQNINKETTEIHILHPKEFSIKESESLRKYKTIKEKLPFKDIDLLIVDEMGKNIFGTGMDTTITGKKEGLPKTVQWLFVRDLTEETHGNAQGIGLADFTTERLVNKIDYKQMYLNSITAYRTDTPKIPMFLKNDKEILETILKYSSNKDSKSLRIVWIKNTLKLNKLLISESFFDDVVSRDDLSFMGDPEPMEFDSEGFLVNSKKYWFND